MREECCNDLNNRESSYRQTCLVIFALGFVIWTLIACYLPLIDPSEGRYATIAQKMAETGDYVTPLILKDGEWIPFLGKPPLYFWVLSASINIFGVNEFAVRMPGIIASTALLFLMFWVIKRYKDEESAYLSVLITGTSGLFFIVSTTILADVVMTLFAIGALFLYYGFLNETGKRMRYMLSLAVFAFLGLAFLCKGPVALVIFGLPVFLWTLVNNQWHTLKYHAWISGMALFLLITTPWFYFASKIHPDFLEYFFVNENFKRFVSSDYGDRYGTGHQYPHGMSALFFGGGSLPWLLLLAGLVIYKVLKIPKGQRKNFLADMIFYKKTDRRFIDLFFLGFVSVVLFWCLAKQLHFYYLFTVIPPFAVWCSSLLKKYKVSFKWISALALFTLLCYFAGFSVIPFVSNKKITKYVLSDIRGLSKEPLKKNSVIFVNFKHPSAYFYGKETLLIYPSESMEQSLSRDVQFYVIRRKDYDRHPEIDYSSFNRVIKDKAWVVMQKKSNRE